MVVFLYSVYLGEAEGDVGLKVVVLHVVAVPAAVGHAEDDGIGERSFQELSSGDRIPAA